MANELHGLRISRASMILGAAAMALVARTPLSHAADTDGLTMDEEIKMVSTGKTTDMKMHVETRGDASRITTQLNGQNQVMLRPGDGRTIMLMPQMNMYMALPMPAAAPATSQPAGSVTVTDTGKSQKIDGHAAEGYLVTVKPAQPGGATHELTYWMVKDFPDAAKINALMKNSPFGAISGGRGARGGAGAAPPDQSALMHQAMPADAGVMLRMETTDTDGTLTIDVTNLKIAPVADADLQIPSGYTDMSGMMQGMPAGMPNIPGRGN